MATAEQPPQPLFLSFALDYAQQHGWHVFPLHSPARKTYCDCGDAACVTNAAKHPWTTHGFRDASADERVIRRWWGKSWPNANIGIACGASRLVVLDVDPRHGGELALVELVRRHAGAKPGQLTPVMEALTATLTSETGGGGEHYVFRAPAGVTIRNDTDLDDLRGLDVRADGGYFVAPPSMHVSGARYLWRDGITEPRELPEWLIPVLTRRKSRPQAQPVRMFTPPREVSETAAYWLDRALHLAHEGNRNDRGFWLACQLRDSGLSQDAAEGALESYAARVPGSDYTAREAIHSARSAYKAPARERARSMATGATSSAPLTAAAGAGATGSLSSAPAPALAAAQIAVAPESQPTDTRPRFQFLTDEEVENMPPPEWLIGGFLVAQRLSVLYGEFGSYKSFLALDLALSVATGIAWHGQPVKQGPVAYIAGEGIGGLGKRLRAWKQARQWQGSAPIHLLGVAPQLLRSDDVHALCEALEALPAPPALIVIDTLARSMVGGDENSAEDMGMAVAAADMLRATTGAHALLIHHKPSGAAKTRGSTALPGAADTLIEVAKDTVTPGVITMSCEKQKDAAPFAARRLRFEIQALDSQAGETSGTLVLDESPVQKRPTLPRSARMALAILKSAPLYWADLKRIFKEQSGLTERSLGNAIDLLEQEHLIENVGGMWRLTEEGEQA